VKIGIRNAMQIEALANPSARSSDDTPIEETEAARSFTGSPLRLTRSFRTERRVTTIRTVPRRGVCATAKLARAVLAHAGVSHHGVAGAGPLRKARGPPPASLGREASWSLANET